MKNPFIPLALRTLSDIKDTRAIDLLIYKLEKENTQVVQEVAKDFGHIRNPRVIQSLIDIFRHD
jgi:HEAT repeat protein